MDREVSVKLQMASELRTVELGTDRPAERLFVHTLSSLPAVQFWTVRSSDRHWAMHHETFTACLVLGPGEMRASWRYRGRERIVSARDIQLMQPVEMHLTTGASEPASFFVIWWEPSFVQRVAEEMDQQWPVQLTTCQTADPVFAACLIDIYRAVQASDAQLLHPLVFEATTQLIERCSESAVPSSALAKYHPAVTKALALLRERYSDRVSLDDLARAAGLSKFHLARCFRRNCGLAPHAYQKLVRVSEAKRCLEQGQSIKEAALMSGFADQAHFCRTFKNLVGVSPRTWMRAVRSSVVADLPACQPTVRWCQDQTVQTSSPAIDCPFDEDFGPKTVQADLDGPLLTHQKRTSTQHQVTHGPARRRFAGMKPSDAEPAQQCRKSPTHHEDQDDGDVRDGRDGVARRCSYDRRLAQPQSHQTVPSMSRHAAVVSRCFGWNSHFATQLLARLLKPLRPCIGIGGSSLRIGFDARVDHPRPLDVLSQPRPLQ